MEFSRLFQTFNCRFSLTEAGLPKDVINRIYRCLFVYSTGFHQLLTKLLSHTEGKYRTIKSIWRTFAVLLEYWCKTDYESLLSDIEREYQEQQEFTESKYQSEIEYLRKSHVELQAAVDAMQSHVNKLEREAYNEKRLRDKAEAEFEQLRDNIESEVTLRMQFEDKVILNLVC